VLRRSPGEGGHYPPGMIPTIPTVVW
jgi:hypothetical protein